MDYGLAITTAVMDNYHGPIDASLAMVIDDGGPSPDGYDFAKTASIVGLTTQLATHLSILTVLKGRLKNHDWIPTRLPFKSTARNAWLP
ncbi:MAG TPA: hypothetical protein VHN11_11065 [Xanthobacteraceae bacterium]|jgi:hypothetical protein|nr:hypothetical protein [Xanthobacteraceae bacterium]